jgi:hypothetical protein
MEKCSVFSQCLLLNININQQNEIRFPHTISNQTNSSTHINQASYSPQFRFQSPNCFGWLTNPKKAAYNKVYNKTPRGCLVNLLLLVSFGVFTISIPSCDFKKSDSAGGTYVKPSITRTGKFRKGYVRRKVSINKNAIKNQNRSRYYYQSRGKYRRKNY